MKLFETLEPFPSLSKPIVLTIGNFDGVHLGHQALLQRVIYKTKQCHGESAVITFNNHPTEVLKKETPPFLCTIPHKRLLIEAMGIDNLFLIPFTLEFSYQTDREFIEKLAKMLPLKELVLGHDALIGKDRHGSKENVIKICRELNIGVEYLTPFAIDDRLISSTIIRQTIQKGDLQAAQKLLGRPYSVYGKIVKGLGLGKKLGYPTANIPVEGLCLPPYGIYAAFMRFEGRDYPGVISLGVAPTVRKDNKPVLEIHLFDQPPDISGKCVEIFFKRYLREERKFDTLEELSHQIALDVAQAKQSTHNR